MNLWERDYDRHPSVDEPLSAATTVTPAWMHLWARLRPLPQIDWTLCETGRGNIVGNVYAEKQCQPYSCVAPAHGFIRGADDASRCTSRIIQWVEGVITVEGGRAVRVLLCSEHAFFINC